VARDAGERDALVCLGQIGAPHGVRGEVRLRSFTAKPEAIAAYGTLQIEDGRAIAIESLRAAKDHFVATLSGIHDRDAAAQLANQKLYVPRERLPQLADPEEFYHSDLIGLAVIDSDGRRLGKIVAIHNFGAGDLLELRLDASSKTELLAFNDANVPRVDVAGGRLVLAEQAVALLAARPAEENDGSNSLPRKTGG
jgi:16S rRNA processing protein RimM